jgi:FkbM family methyltransferase
MNKIRSLFRGLLVALGVRWLLLQVGRVLFPTTRPKVMQIRIMDVDLLVLVNEDVGRRMVFVGRYETRDADFLLRCIRPTDVCFDIGANTGYYTMLMAKVAVQGEVHSFEPVRINWHLLGGGVELNRFGNIVSNNSAAGAEEGEMSFSQSTDGAYSSLVAVGRRPEKSQIKVRVETIDAYSANKELRRIDVMKIDVEGAEALVLAGGKRVLQSTERRPRVAMIELNSENLKAYGSSIESIVSTMNGFGYSAIVVLSNGMLADYRRSFHDIHQNVFFLTESAMREMYPQRI